MAIDLSGTPLLEAAQDSQSRHPLVEILSQPMTDDIPFDGQSLTSETTNEQKPNAITHSSGRLCLLYGFNSTNYDLKYAYTDVDRSSFSIVTFNAYGTLIEACLCELANGNIGIIYISKDGGDITRYLRRMVISPTGTVIEADATIASYTTADYVIDMPFVLKVVSGTYLLVYFYQDVFGATYSVMKRTSADFVTWGAEAACSIAGLDADKPCYNPSLLQITTGDIWLWLEYREDYIPEDNLELTNIYYSVSADDGANWSAATKITNYTTFGEIGRHPIGFQKAVNQMHLVFTKEMGALHINGSSFNWCGTDAAISDLSFDSVNRKLYATALTAGTSAGYLSCVVKIDVDTWSIERCWDCGTTPGFSSIFADEAIGFGRNQGGSYLIPVLVAGIVIGVVDGEANTITEYIFFDDVEHSLTANVTWTPIIGGPGSPSLQFTWIDFAAKRLYVCISYGYAPAPGLQVGYIDLTAPGPAYTMTNIVEMSGYISTWDANSIKEFFVVPSENYIMISTMTLAFEGPGATMGRLLIFDLVSGGMIKDYNIVANPGFPKWGLSRCCYYDGKIYGAFPYEADFGEQDKRGLCIVDLETDLVTYSRPSWATLDDYKLNRFHVTADGKLIISTDGYGVTVYDTADNSWVLHNNDSIPGMTANGEDHFSPVSFDEDTGMVFTGVLSDNVTGLVAFSLYGMVKQSQYMLGAYTDSWAFAAAAQFLQGWMDYEAVVALDPDDQSIYAFWTESLLSELSLKWDKEEPQFDLSPYLVMGSEITLKKSIDGTPGSLSFQISHGHLFDSHNSLSLWKIYLAKFRKLNIRFGEKISEADYWQQQGVFFVTETKIDPGYERPVYPTMTVKAEDRLAMFEFAEVVSTEYYSTYPETIIQDILMDQAGLEAGDINISNFDTRAYCYIQWIEQTIKMMIEQISERFGYYIRIDVDGKVTARKISTVNAVDHIYSDLSKLANLSPDDSFSDWTNRIIIKGDGRDWMEVLYNEESVGSASGACGWWHEKIRQNIWYSTDHSRKCRYPRMEVIESVEDGPYFCEDGNEYIGAMSDELGLYLYINGPDLNETLISAIIIWIIFKLLAVVLNAIPWIGGLVSLVMWIGETYALYNVMAIMGTEGRYEYNFYARPLGYVRQSFQANANDEELQTLMGMYNTKMIEDPLCYTIAQCQEVADFEMMVVKAQRKRITCSKITHLQDEEGDTIQINHPITNLAMKIFITDLERVIKLPSSSDSGNGSFTDNIEGWNVI